MIRPFRKSLQFSSLLPFTQNGVERLKFPPIQLGMLTALRKTIYFNYCKGSFRKSAQMVRWLVNTICIYEHLLESRDHINSRCQRGRLHRYFAVLDFILHCQNRLARPRNPINWRRAIFCPKAKIFNFELFNELYSMFSDCFWRLKMLSLIFENVQVQLVQRLVCWI